MGGHRWVALLGTAGCTAGHSWVHCWAHVGRTGGWHCWASIIRALVISALMIGANPCSDNCRADHVVKGRCDWPFTTSRDQLCP
ncbi:unnamed protein product [Staurois parvus]|uniref:Secreted protein n=1 Tax=Staurois parvus TaxID=386267 RepID=A0ABN9B5X0_9NEOB|nr:unnamed protein product [Staurois parvus]